MFKDREDAALQLAARLSPRTMRDPVVLGIPRGGVVIAAILARQLGAELDVVLARKLRAPWQPELALGAIGEDGLICLTDFASALPGGTDAGLAAEAERQAAEIERRKALFRAVRPPAELAGRTVIVADDGIATGSTVLAALHVLQARQARERIVAVPVAPPETLARIARQCEHVECLLAPVAMDAISLFYRNFEQVEDEEVLRLLRAAAKERARA